MTTYKRTDYKYITRFVVPLFGLLLLWPATGLALTACPYIHNPMAYCQDIDNLSDADQNKDCDSDGFTDLQECQGFQTLGGKQLYGYGMDTSSSSYTPPISLNPMEPDLMFIAGDSSGNELQSGSLMKQALDSAKSNNALTIYSDSLKIHTHQISKADCSNDPLKPRLITGDSTRAAMIKEMVGENSSDFLGDTNQNSTPSDFGTESKIYTTEIENDVRERCDNKQTCCVIKKNRKEVLVPNLDCTDSNIDNTAVFNFYTLQVIAHEVGHGTKLAQTGDPTNYHYRSSGTIMDPSVTFKNGTYTIPNDFLLPSDSDEVTLHE